uniref:C-type lectin domain-containing protein n=1 Tax=Sinocyclocheilus rhinocerous TaxID=307959 RepID=A0A673HNC3_9TELE
NTSIRGLVQLNTIDFPAAAILSKASCDPYRFVLMKKPKTWAEAQSYCRETYMDLTMVQSDEDRANLKEAADAVNFTSVTWIGFYSDPWRWLFQDMAISYANWDYKEPDLPNTNESCAFVKRNGLWGDTYCTELKYLFCRTGKKLYNLFWISTRVL